MISKPLKLVITFEYTFSKIRSIIENRRPAVLILQSKICTLNDKTMEYADYVSREYDYEMINTKIVKKYRNKSELKMLQFMLKKNSFSSFQDDPVPMT